MIYAIRVSSDYDERFPRDRNGYPTDDGYKHLGAFYPIVGKASLYGNAMDMAEGLAIRAFIEGKYGTVVTVWDTRKNGEALPIYVALPKETYLRLQERLTARLTAATD